MLFGMTDAEEAVMVAYADEMQFQSLTGSASVVGDEGTSDEVSGIKSGLSQLDMEDEGGEGDDEEETLLIHSHEHVATRIYMGSEESEPLCYA